MTKDSTLKAILKAKCPRCHQGDIYLYPATKLTKFHLTHKQCPHCGVYFQPEPGFFFGAMYVSYAFSVIILLGTAFVINALWDDPSFWVYVVLIPSLTLLLMPLNFRYSRVLYLYVFSGIRYNPGEKQ